MERATPYIALVGRILLALIFVVAGYSKIGGYDGTLQYMQAFGLPGFLLPLVIFAELGGGLALIFGLLTRTAAAGLAVFSVVSAFIFHSDSADAMQGILFMKNIAMAGGLLYVVAYGAGKFSVDEKLGLKF
ncbi:MAG: DoxX family protein [Alcanivoracaceae bacterium]|nr:DoxX family protein [Alcanivoracaceae bacterium]